MVSYRVTDTTGDVVSADITVTYLPVAADDSDLGNVLGSTVNVAVLGNDPATFSAATPTPPPTRDGEVAPERVHGPPTAAGPPPVAPGPLPVRLRAATEDPLACRPTSPRRCRGVSPCRVVVTCVAG